MFEAASGTPFDIGTKWYLIHISRATNSYDLLEDLKKVILEEPARLRMNDWVTYLAGRKVSSAVVPQPACGTVACCSGWLALLRRNRAISESELIGYNDHKDFPVNASVSVHALFYEMVDHLEFGTVAYAEYIANKISDIQLRHEADLKAFKLEHPAEYKGYA